MLTQDQAFCPRKEARLTSVGGKASWSIAREPGLETGGIWRKTEIWCQDWDHCEAGKWGSGVTDLRMEEAAGDGMWWRLGVGGRCPYAPNGLRAAAAVFKPLYQHERAQC